MSAAFSFDGPVEVVAHRGYSARAPENTLAAMDLAIESGADALEFDLHAAKDGTPVLFHDATLNRTTNGTGRVGSTGPDELATLDAGSWFGPDYAGEPIPRLDVTLERVRGRVRRLYAEIKGYRGPRDVDRMVDVVARAKMLNATVFISMDWDALARVRTTRPDARLGYIVEDRARIEAGIDRARGDSGSLLDFDARLLLADPAVAARAGADSIPLAAWTVDDVSDAERLLAMGVPRITTNEVEAMDSWRKTL